MSLSSGPAPAEDGKKPSIREAAKMAPWLAIVALAALGKAWWFLGLAAVGTPVFLLLLVWLGRRD